MFKVRAIGSDPEFILLDKNEKPLSAIGINNSTDKVKVYSDNVLVEFNHEPFKPENFAQGMKGVLKEVSGMVTAFNKDSHYVIGQCEGIYGDEELASPEAHEIGCDPFLSAYDLASYQVPKPYETNHRFAGGHIHISYDTETLPPHILVKLLDEHLLPLDPNYNKTKRSEFYGAKGSFRLKPYGLEYRATSNWWLEDPQIIVDVLKKVESHVNKTYYGA